MAPRDGRPAHDSSVRELSEALPAPALTPHEKGERVVLMARSRDLLVWLVASAESAVEPASVSRALPPP